MIVPKCIEINLRGDQHGQPQVSESLFLTLVRDWMPSYPDGFDPVSIEASLDGDRFLLETVFWKSDDPMHPLRDMDDDDEDDGGDDDEDDEDDDLPDGPQCEVEEDSRVTQLMRREGLLNLLNGKRK